MSQVDSLGAASSEAATANGNWKIRFYRDGDIPAMVELVNETAAADGRDTHLTVEDFSRQINVPIVDPYTQIVVVESPTVAGRFEGYGRAIHISDESNGERLYQIGLTARPSAREAGLEKALAARILQIIREHEADPTTSPARQVNVLAGASEKSKSTIRLYEEIGLTSIRHGWVMERSLLDIIPEPKEVEGVVIRPYRRPEDNVAAHTKEKQRWYGGEIVPSLFLLVGHSVRRRLHTLRDAPC